MSAMGHKRTFSDTPSNVCFWGQSGHKSDSPPESRCAITSPRASESNFFGNLWRGKRGRACRFHFLRGKVAHSLVEVEGAIDGGLGGSYEPTSSPASCDASRPGGRGRAIDRDALPRPEDIRATHHPHVQLRSKIANEVANVLSNTNRY